MVPDHHRMGHTVFGLLCLIGFVPARRGNRGPHFAIRDRGPRQGGSTLPIAHAGGRLDLNLVTQHARIVFILLRGHILNIRSAKMSGATAASSVSSGVSRRSYSMPATTLIACFKFDG